MEIRDVRQVPGEGRRRWFTDPRFDLIVWYENDQVSGFQLCYGKPNDERALTWYRPARYTHMRVDDGEVTFGTKGTPVLVPDGAFDHDGVAREFAAASAGIDRGVAALVLRELGRYPRLSVEVKPLAPALVGDYLRFFDEVAFTDNPE